MIFYLESIFVERWVGKRIKERLNYFMEASKWERASPLLTWSMAAKPTSTSGRWYLCHFCLFVVAAMSRPPVLCYTHAMSISGEGVAFVTFNSKYFGRFKSLKMNECLPALIWQTWFILIGVIKSIWSIWPMPGNRSWSHCLQFLIIDVLNVQSPQPHRRRSFYHTNDNDLLFCS